MLMASKVLHPQTPVKGNLPYRGLAQSCPVFAGLGGAVPTGTMQLTRRERGIHAAETNGHQKCCFRPDSSSFARTFRLLHSDRDVVHQTLPLPTSLRHECRAPTALSRIRAKAVGFDVDDDRPGTAAERRGCGHARPSGSPTAVASSDERHRVRENSPRQSQPERAASASSTGRIAGWNNALWSQAAQRSRAENC